MRRKYISIFLCLTILITVFTGLSVSAEPDGGSCGENVTWFFDAETGTLTISGSGEMENFGTYHAPSSWRMPPWPRPEVKTVVIENGVESIGNNAFYSCNSLTSITIPSTLTKMDPILFFESFRLSEINVDQNNPKYSSENGVLFNKNKTILYFYPYGKSGEYVIPDSVTSIGSGAFEACSSMTSVTIPNSVTSIEAFTFNWCTSLTSITIPDSVTSIGDHTFSVCSSLTSVTIPNNVTSIGQAAFSECTKISDVYYNGTKEQWNEIDIGTDNDCLTNANIHFVIKGDIDGDGKATLKDTCSLKRILLGVWAAEPTSKEFIAADMNGDGRVDTRDAFLLKKKILIG